MEVEVEVISCEVILNCAEVSLGSVYSSTGNFQQKGQTAEC